MNKEFNRRDFVKTTAMGGIGLGLTSKITSIYGKSSSDTTRVGIIGLDTSHSVAFTKALNSPDAGVEFKGYKVVAAYPKGSNGGGRSTKSESVNLCVRFLIVI